MDKNAELLSLYKNGLKSLTSSKGFKVQPAYPFMIRVPDDYDEKVKIMIIGQETNGWPGEMDKEPEKSMQGYKRFWIDKESKYSKTGTFHQVLNKFQKMLDKERTSCIWNNIIKIGKKDKIGTPPDEMITWQHKWFDITKREVELLKPNVVIFLTGPNYDLFIKKTFGEFTVSKATQRKTRQLAKLNFLDNKEIIAFRTYHPNYLRQSGLENEILNYLKQEIRSQL